MWKIAFFLFLATQFVQCRWNGKEPLEDLDKKKPKPNSAAEKFFYYDNHGNLLVNGSIPGNSSAITIDFKKYYPTCYTNVYYNFIFSFDPSGNLSNGICDKGMTICYEGQLIGEHMRPEFNLSNLRTGKPNDYFKKCQYGTGGRSYSIRGLNVAVEIVRNIKLADIKSEAKNFKILDEPKGSAWIFYVISSSFFAERYYFIAPTDGILVLQIGQGKRMDIRITNTEGADLPLVTFTKQGKKYGAKDLGGPPPDMNNGKKLHQYRGLWLLYLDFKSDYQSWQIISVVNPPRQNRCNMMLEVRGNRMRACRSYFEDIAVMEPVDANVKMTFTMEVGTVRTQDYGQEDVKSTSSRWQKEQLRQSTTTDHQHDTTEDKTITEDGIKEVTEKEKSVMTQEIYKGELEVSLHANPEKAIRDQASNLVGQGDQAGVDAKVGVGANAGHTNTKYESTRDVHVEEKIRRDTNNAFTDMTRSKAMMESFKSTSGAAESMEQGEFLSTSSAFSSREIVDMTVNLPPNTKLVIRQLFFDCDGNVVKMPFILYTNGTERLDLVEQNVSPKFEKPLKPNWANQTSERNLRNEGNNNGGDEAANPSPLSNEKKEKDKSTDAEEILENYED